MFKMKKNPLSASPFGFTNKVMKIVLLEGIHPQAHKWLGHKGLKAKSASKVSLTELKKTKPVALGIRSRSQICASLLRDLPSLRAIGAFCIGTDQIDLKACTKAGIPVFNAPYGNTRSVAELVIGHIIALSRRLWFFNYTMHQNQWHKTAKGSREVRNKSLGLVGYGRIGTQVGILAEAMGMRVFYHDIKEVLPIGNVRAVKTLRELLSLSDFVSFHVPETPLTKNMIRSVQLKSMRKGAFLINTSRGSVVNLKDLKEALKKNHLAGCAVDVFPEEPHSSGGAFATGLEGMKQAVLTPHIAGSTEEAQQNIAGQVSKSLSDFLLYGISEGAVNFPVLNPAPLCESEEYQRIVNIHQNIPGVLGKINSIVSRLKANIRTQLLATHESMGYLIMDVQKTHKHQILKAVSDLKSSLRTYLLP